MVTNEENSAVEKFDPATLMNGVKDRIRATFVSLIPEAQWEQMVQKEIDDFFTKQERINYGSYRPTEFTQLCHSLLNAEAAKRIKTYLDQPEFAVTWNDKGKPVIDATIKKLILDNAGEMLAQILSAPFANALDMMRNNLRNAGGY